MRSISPRFARVRIAVAVPLGAALAIAAFAGCTVDTSPTSVESAAPSTQPPPTRDAAAQAAAENERLLAEVREMCEGSPERADTGARDGANGGVTETDGVGRATVYLVATGDTLTGVADRFCIPHEDLTAIHGDNATLYAEEHIALTQEAWPAARRASGYLYPACPLTSDGFPITASISWMLSDGVYHAEDIGTLVDTGAAYGARGTVRTDAAGALLDYTVATNDNWRGIKDRFCMDPYFLDSLIGEWDGEDPMIHPGDVIPLQPQFLELPE